MILLALLPPLQGLDRVVISHTPGSPEPSVRDHLGLFAATPPAFEQRFQQKRLTYMQTLAKQMGYQLIAAPDLNQVSG